MDPASQNVYGLPFVGASESTISRIRPAPFHYQKLDLLYSVDFACEVGTPIVAALEGIVSEVRDGFDQGGFDPAFMGRANMVFIEHMLGETSIYVHMKKGLIVQVGDYVHAGQHIGFSGLSGFTGYPHLHFDVRDMDFKSIPIRFKVRNGVCVLVSPKLGRIPEMPGWRGE